MKTPTSIQLAFDKVGVVPERPSARSSNKTEKTPRRKTTKKRKNLHETQNSKTSKPNNSGRRRRRKKGEKRGRVPELSPAALEAVYGGISNANKGTKPGKSTKKQKIECCLPSPFNKSPLFSDVLKDQQSMLKVSDSLQWRSNTRKTNTDTVIIIGLDFGTSSAKVVLRDTSRRRAMAVPFFKAGTQNQFFLPAKLFENERGDYSLSLEKIAHRNLKLCLLERDVDLVSMIHAVSYLSALIRYCQGWLWDNHCDTYVSDNIFWGLNLGLPAASYENDWLVERFLLIAIAAKEASDSAETSLNSAKAVIFIRHAENEIKKFKSRKGYLQDIAQEKYPVRIIPEIAAQVHGFVESDSWDSRGQPMMMMVDIGAGTVDASVFNVTRSRNSRRFSFLGNNVAPLGVMNLHRARLHWLRNLIQNYGNQWTDDLDRYFYSIAKPTDRAEPIPESFSGYLPGIAIEGLGEKDIDHGFYTEYAKQLHQQTLLKVQNKTGSLPKRDKLPFFLCGGGRNMALYQRFSNMMNRHDSGGVMFNVLEIPRPKKLEANGLRSNEYHRLSVAYGLSFDNIGQFVTPDRIPDFTAPQAKSGWKQKIFNRYVDKDQM